MANLQLLNTKSHQDMRVQMNFPDHLGYGGTIMVLPCEIQEVQREYPVIFRKHGQTGQLFPCALLGFEEKENLYTDDSGQWLATYKPLSIAKGPFLIGLDKNEDLQTQQPLVYIDVDDPRVGSSKGERVFTDSGELTPYMATVSQALRILHQESGAIPQMVEAFSSLNLIEPVQMRLDLVDGRTLNLGGAYTIDAERLLTLSSEQLFTLNGSGFLSCAFYIAGSLNNVNKLLQIKNRKHINKSS